MRAKNEGEMFEFRFSFVSYFFSCFSFAFCSSFVRILSSYIFFSFYNLPYRSVNTFRLPFPKFSILKNKLRISAKFVIVRVIQTVTKEAIMKIKSVAVLGAGAVGSYVIWGLSEKKDIRLWTTMVDSTPNRGEMTSTASRAFFIKSNSAHSKGRSRLRKE